MVRYSRHSRSKRTSRRRSVRRTYRRGTRYSRRGRRTYRRYSKYPRRVRAPGLDIKRKSRTTEYEGNPSSEPSFRYDTSQEFDTETQPTGRRTAVWAVKLTDSQGGNQYQRVGTQIYVHGFRFQFYITHTFPSGPADLWQNGCLHFALVQKHDPIETGEALQPEFSAPIGAPTNDTKDTVAYNDYSITRNDIIFGKLRSSQYNVITHRKFYVTRSNEQQHPIFEKNIQFYIPIKKRVAFESDADHYGMKPFYMMMWYVPINQENADAMSSEEIKYVDVNDVKHVTYFKSIKV